MHHNFGMICICIQVFKKKLNLNIKYEKNLYIVLGAAVYRDNSDF